MSNKTEQLIAELAANLRPVHRAGRVGHLVFAWCVIAGAYSWFAILATGPVRDGAFAALLQRPVFALETLLGFAAIATLAWAALRMAIPGEPRAAVLKWPAIVGLAWIALLAAGVWHPSQPASMLGKRDHCVWQSLLIGLPSLLALLWLARGLLPVWPRWTDALAGAAAAGFPAAIMQFACMYSPAHGLMFHIAPMAYTVILGTAAGHLALSRRSRPLSR
jgi:hypothetical protein